MSVIIVYNAEDFLKALHSLAPHIWLIWIDVPKKEKEQQK